MTQLDESLDPHRNPRQERSAALPPEPRDVTVRVQDLSKWFPRRANRRPLFNILRGSLRQPASDDNGFYAVRNVTFEVTRGEKIGVVGNNGAGKTTLLKLLAGLFRPTAGEIQIEGSTTLLSGLGLGMLDELSVEQNVYLYGAIYGIPRSTLSEQLEEILEWAELEDFAHARLRTLSKGMRTRLAFSTTRHIVADVFLLDEALSGGDRAFRDKCLSVFDSYKASSGTYIVSSHNTAFLRHLCDRTLWLHHGEPRAFDDTDTVLEQYEDFTKTSPRR